MIKGLTPVLAECGKIKIGGLGSARTSSAGKEYRVPEKWDHFRITRTIRDNKGDLEIDRALMDELPKDADGKCRRIPILLHSNEIDEVFPSSYALYQGRQLWCSGDGEVARRHLVAPDKSRSRETRDAACPCDKLGAKGKSTCKPHATLRCSIRVDGHATAGAVYMWRTTSIISIQRMLGSLQQIKATIGVIANVPLVLHVGPVDVTPQDAPATRVYCCHVQLHASDLLSVQRQAMELSQNRAALAGPVAHHPALPPASEWEDDDEQSEVQQEFHPDPTEGHHADAIDAVVDDAEIGTDWMGG